MQLHYYVGVWTELASLQEIEGAWRERQITSIVSPGHLPPDIWVRVMGIYPRVDVGRGSKCPVFERDRALHKTSR